MKRVKLTVAYDGTAYCGWQIQPNGNTIEKELNEAIKNITGETIQVIGASRTDSGVHALCNVAVFDTKSKMPAEKFSYALNTFLPEDIRVVQSEQVDLDFHPRYCESKKTYEYRIDHERFPNPMLRLYTHFVYGALDVDAMRKATEVLVGEHDFKSFCSVGTVVKTTVRTIYLLEIEEVDTQIIIRIQGNGFLYNMVRIIAGTLIDIGLGRIDVQEMKEILEAKNRQAAGPTAPAKGLHLVAYEFRP